RIPVARWPCPRAKEGTTGCRKRFWSDGESRRSSQSEQRTFDESQDTFACRFYHRLTSRSPCETYLLRDYFRLYDEIGDPVPNQPVECELSDGSVVEKITDENGGVFVSGSRIIEVRVSDVHEIV